MNFSPQTITDLILLLVWAALWALGGIGLARGAFRLRASEELLVGLALGFILQNWLANWLVRLADVPVASWVSSALVFAAGLILALRLGGWRELRFAANPWHALALLAILYTFFMICRGMAIFDDYAHLPTVSIMATGDIPPHFSLDPQVVYGYHHFLLLFSAQIMRVADLAPWSALDVGRALSFALAVMLAGIWTQRLTRNKVVGLLGAAMMAFGSGTRWLLLLFPHRVVLWLGRNMQLLGSGASSGENLGAALMNAWAVEGVGPVPFPFAFANGIYPPGVINAHGANGLVSFVVILLLLLTFNRWRSWVGAALSVVVLSTWGLLTEVELVVILAGWGLVALVYAVQHRSLRLPVSLWAWLGVAGAGALLGFFAGGAWTDLIFKKVQQVMTGVEPASYQTVGFTLAPPAIVSSHLGVLSLLDPAQLLVGLLEIGPVLLVLPLLVIFGLRAYRFGRWYEAATAAAAVVSLALIFVQFTGSTGVRNTPRLYVFIPLCAVFAVPLVWWWASRQAAAYRVIAALLGMVTLTGGLVMFGIELIAVQRPVYSYLVTPLDVKMYEAHWNRLEPDALVFDLNASRGTTVLGRFTDSSYTWFHNKPLWEALAASPEPFTLRAAGFDYFYLDNLDWDGFSPEIQESLQAACVQQVDEYQDQDGNFRRLLNLQNCK